MSDTATLPKYQSAEKNGGGKPRNEPGIYRHEASGAEVITHPDPNDGSIQADALVRVGYHRVGDVPSRVEMAKLREERLKREEEAEKSRKAGEAAPVHNGTTSPSVSELQEAKDKAEAELAETKATLEALKAGKETEDKKKKEEK